MALTELKRRFVEHYTAGPTAGNGTASLRAAGSKVKNDNSAAARASQLLKEPEVQAYRDALLLGRQAAVADHLQPWRDLIPQAQALQRETIEAARRALVQLQVTDGAGRATVNLKKVSGPVAGLIKAGLEAASTVEAYGLGKPISRTEVGEPGAFRTQGLREMVAEIREGMELLEAAGYRDLLLNPATIVEVEAEAVDQVPVEH